MRTECKDQMQISERKALKATTLELEAKVQMQSSECKVMDAKACQLEN